MYISIRNTLLRTGELGNLPPGWAQTRHYCRITGTNDKLKNLWLYWTSGLNKKLFFCLGLPLAVINHTFPTPALFVPCAEAGMELSTDVPEGDIQLHQSRHKVNSCFFYWHFKRFNGPACASPVQRKNWKRSWAKVKGCVQGVWVRAPLRNKCFYDLVLSVDYDFTCCVFQRTESNMSVSQSAAGECNFNTEQVSDILILFCPYRFNHFKITSQWRYAKVDNLLFRFHIREMILILF